MAEQAHVRGKVVTFALDKLKPNDWNPNVVTPEKMASIEYGFRTDGWLASQALLVWRKDDKGKTQNVIIDGEHRWKAARNVGLAEGPVVFLDGVSEVDAKSLTIKLNQKRGEWDEDALGKLLREVQGSSEDLGLDFGFDGDELAKLLAFPEESAPDFGAAQDAPETPQGASPPARALAGAAAPSEPHHEAASEPAPQPAMSNVRMVQLFLDDVSQPKFVDDCRKLGERYGTKTVTDTVLRALAELLGSAA